MNHCAAIWGTRAFKNSGHKNSGRALLLISGHFPLRFLLLRILALSHAHLLELVKMLAERSRVRLLKSQTHLALVLC